MTVNLCSIVSVYKIPVKFDLMVFNYLLFIEQDVCAGVPIFVEHWGGDNLQFYPNFALFSTLGGMQFDHYCFHVSKLSEDQKKSLPKIEEFLLPE